MAVVNLDHPRDGDIHTLADFSELLCLLTPDRFCSRDDIKDYIEDKTDKQLNDGDLEDNLAQLIWREAAFGEFYPFKIVEHGKVLHGYEDLTDKQNKYIFLLLCANLPFFKRTDQHKLTEAFERASLSAMKSIWPTTGVVKAFGKNETDYQGPKHERIHKLGIDIGAKPLIDEATFRRRDSGDGGIDLAAWLDLDNHEKYNIPSALAQCACSRSDWVRKTHEISNNRLGSQLCPTHHWMQLIFIPQSFRNNTGNWAVPGEISMTIIMDRLRMITQLENDPGIGYGADEFLNSFTEERLDLV